MTLLSVSAISHQYTDLKVLKEVSLALKSGETVALLAGRTALPAQSHQAKGVPSGYSDGVSGRHQRGESA